MHGLSTEPPCIAPWLVLWAILSAAAVVLNVIVEPWVPLMFFPASAASCSMYYLVRYAQRRSAIKREPFAGGDAWPAAQLFPGPREHTNLYDGAIAALQGNIILLPAKMVSVRMQRIHQPGNVLASAYTASYVLGVAVNLVILYQARRILRAEDNVRCAEAHAMKCWKCQFKQNEPDAAQYGLPTFLNIRPTSLLIAATAFTLVLLYTIEGPLRSRGLPAALSVIPALGLIHHAYFLNRIWRADPSPSPATAILSGSVLPWYLGHFLCVFLYLGAFVAVLLDGPESVQEAPVPAVCVAALLVIHTMAVVVGLFASLTESRVRCEGEGGSHAWTCMRYCNISQEQAKDADAQEDVVEGTLKACFRAHVFGRPF
jgi:hypothetical protein